MPCIVQEIKRNHHRCLVGNAYIIAVQLLFFLSATDNYSLEKLKEETMVGESFKSDYEMKFH